MNFSYQYVPEVADLVKQIADCEGRHTQQAMYSTFHGALTQICFGCLKIRSTIYREQSTNQKEQ